MRPPEFTGGNTLRKRVRVLTFSDRHASMRPPEFTGGNLHAIQVHEPPPRDPHCFNEAAGIHRRKHRRTASSDIRERYARFNEAAGIHRRKPALSVWLMKYPDNHCRFNEAAGIHRRKPLRTVTY